MENNKVLHNNSNNAVTQSILFEGIELKLSSQISEAFNKHFTTVGLKLAGKIESWPSDDTLKYLAKKASGAKFEQFQENADFSRKSTFSDSLPIISQKSRIQNATTSVLDKIERILCTICLKFCLVFGHVTCI